MKNKIILFKGDGEILETRVNKWLEENESKIEVIRIEHQSLVTHLATYVTSTIMVHYIEK